MFLSLFAEGFLGFAFTTIWYLILLVIWVALAFWPARVASRKGYSWLLFFIFSLFFFFIALLVAYLIKDRVLEAEEKVVEEISE